MDDTSYEKSTTNEQFLPELSRLNTINKFLIYTDSVYDTKKIPTFDTAVYVSVVSESIKKRFQFGLQTYSLTDNWIASIFGKLFWFHLLAKVDPNDIIENSVGLCSQQTIVFMEVLNRKKINFRSVGLGYKEGPGHFLCEVYYDNEWHVHDVTKEPDWSKISNHHKSMDYYMLHKDSLYTVYDKKVDKNEFNKLTQKVQYGEVNQYPAKKMLLFHKITRFLTYFFPFLFFFLYLLSKKTTETKI